MLKDMEKSEPWLADLDKDLYDTLKEVYTELVKIDKELEDVKALDILSDEVINTFLIGNSLSVVAGFRDKLTTPFALAKYINLTIQQSVLFKRLSTELEALLNKEKVSWLIRDDFSNQIDFTKVIPVNNYDEKPQSLLVKYRIDPNTDTIIYSIMAGHWGWDIDKATLKALLEGTTLSKFECKEAANTNLSYNISDKNITITAGNIEINVKKM